MPATTPPSLALFRDVAAERVSAAARARRRVEPRDDRAAFLAAGAAVVRDAPPLALVVAVLVPVLALLGMIAAGRQVAALARRSRLDRTRLRLDAAPARSRGAPTASPRAHLVFRLGWSFWSWRRVWLRRLGSAVRVSFASSYPDGRFVEVVRGTSVLEASRIAGIPHASVCGGRGRCSTCRVRVGGAGRAELPPPSPEEAEGAARGSARRQRSARLPAPAATSRYRSDAAAAGRRRPGRGLSPAAAGAWRRARDRRSCSPISAASPRSRGGQAAL